MQDLVSLLQKLNLNQQEAKAYLFCLENGPTTIAQLSKYLQKDRTIIYRLIDKLTNLKILGKEAKQFAPKISAVPPRRLIELIKREERKWKKVELLFAEHLPQLQGIQNSPGTLKPKIHFYEGIEEVRQSWLDHLEQVGEDKTICTFGATTIQTVKQYWPKFNQEYLKVREDKNIFLKLLISDQNKQILSESYNPQLWQVRFSGTASKLNLEVQFSSQSINFTIFEPTPSALILENQQLCTFFKILFEQLWDNATILGP